MARLPKMPKGLLSSIKKLERKEAQKKKIEARKKEIVALKKKKESLKKKLS